MSLNVLSLGAMSSRKVVFVWWCLSVALLLNLCDSVNADNCEGDIIIRFGGPKFIPQSNCTILNGSIKILSTLPDRMKYWKFPNLRWLNLKNWNPILFFCQRLKIEVCNYLTEIIATIIKVIFGQEAWRKLSYYTGVPRVTLAPIYYINPSFNSYNLRLGTLIYRKG